MHEGAPDDYKGLGLVDHMSSGDRSVCICVCLCLSVYRRTNVGLSIHANNNDKSNLEGMICL